MKITVAGFNCDVTADEAPEAVQTFEGTTETVEPQFLAFSANFKWVSFLSIEGNLDSES